MRAFLKSFWPLLAISLIESTILSNYVRSGGATVFAFIQPFGSLYWIAVIMWIEHDARRRRKTPCFDFGFLLWVTAFISIPWYLCSSRGLIKGVLLLIMLIWLSVLPQYVMEFFW